MNLYGSLIVYLTDTFSEHNCQTRASLPPVNINDSSNYFLWRHFET